MAASAPFRYAIVIPSRNRQTYCLEAVRSVTRQARMDAQIIVADNSDDPALLPDLLREADLIERVKLLSSEQRLTMKDNWERALDGATAEWVCFIGDDDALMPHAFEMFDALTTQIGGPCLAWEPLDYRWPCYPGATGGQLAAPSMPPNIVQAPARAFLEQHLYWRTADKWPAIGPSIYHGLVHYRLIDALHRRAGGYFLNFVVDYASAIYNLTAIDSFAYLNAPLTVLGACGASNSAGLTAAGEARRRFDDIMAENPGLRPLYPELCDSRLHAPLVAAGYADLFGRLGRDFMLTPEKMLRSCLAELRGLVSETAFLHEQELLTCFARSHKLDSNLVRTMAFSPACCGVGSRPEAKRFFIDTKALGWNGMGDLLAHIHALTPTDREILRGVIASAAPRLGIAR